MSLGNEHNSSYVLKNDQDVSTFFYNNIQSRAEHNQYIESLLFYHNAYIHDILQN